MKTEMICKMEKGTELYAYHTIIKSESMEGRGQRNSRKLDLFVEVGHKNSRVKKNMFGSLLVTDFGEKNNRKYHKSLVSSITLKWSQFFRKNEKNHLGHFFSEAGVQPIILK